MTNKRSIIIFWALFLVPTLIVAAVAFRLLSHEQDRLHRSAQAALTQQAKTLSETIHLTIEDVQQNLTLSLLALEQKQIKSRLVQWEHTNPLVRNVFIYTKEQGLEYPLDGMASTKEERLFAVRYDALFSGRTSFDFNREGRQEISRTGTGLKKEIRADSYGSIEDDIEKSSRKTLVALSRVRQKPLAESLDAIQADQQVVKFKEKSGWIPWFNENRLYILGWVQKKENDPVYGVELELMTLLSRLVADFPKLEGKNAALVMMDGSGMFMHQSGALNVDSGQSPLAAVAVSNLLPHWRMAVFVDSKSFSGAKGFLYLSVILLGILICAIISGGVMLTRMALQNQKDARKKISFVSSVSHELKTPLTSIRMYAELLSSGRVKDTDKSRSYLSVIVDESHRLTRLINNVLDFGRLEQGKKKYHPTRFELDRFLKHMIEAHTIRIEKQGMEIKIQISKGDFAVRTDKDALEQVVLNLLDNALKYAGDGKFIQFVLEKEGPFTSLKICDNGPGIPKEQREKIFEKFHRVDDSLGANQPGSGLGLSIARQILQDLGGDLFFEPMPGNGSCFTARIQNYETH